MVLTVSAMICIAATNTSARESEGHRSSAKSGASKHSKAARSKGSSSKRKSAAKSSRSRAAEKKANRLRDTGDIDVSNTVWKDLPPEELPVSDADDADDDASQ